MTDQSSLWRSAAMNRKLSKRYASERRFKWAGVLAIVLSLSFLAFLLITMMANGLGGIDWAFLSGSDSTDPGTAGIWGAFKGSLLTMGVTLALSFPMGVLSAMYLEEFAPKSRWVDIVEVSINNLAAVPSIIFGLLGLAVFITAFGLPRSAPLVGGMTMALMTFPVIVKVPTYLGSYTGGGSDAITFTYSATFKNGNTGSISRTYAVGDVAGSTRVGGLVGWNLGTTSAVNNSYWDTTSTGQTAGFGQNNGTFTGAGRTTTATCT